MKVRTLLTFAFLLANLTSVPAFAVFDDPASQETRQEKDLEEHDFEAIREFLSEKRKESLVDRGENAKLNISGDVRFEWQHLTERGPHFQYRDVNLRGGSALKGGIKVSRNDFDIECNLRFDYRGRKTWAVTQLQFDNGAGVGAYRNCFDDPEGPIGSGQCNDICVKRAYVGYNVYTCDKVRLDLELGRRKLYDVFESYIQFQSRFDGLLVKYTDSRPELFDFYWYGAAFIVDERADHFGFVQELGFIDIADAGFDFRYSLIWWPKIRGKDRCCLDPNALTQAFGKRFVRNAEGWQFIDSQFSFSYNLDPEILCTPVEFYGAFLINHYAKKRFLQNNPSRPHHGERVTPEQIAYRSHRDTHRDREKLKPKQKQNIGWYVGVLIGEVKEEGDWSLDLTYEYVQAQAIQENDVAGIGRGNVLDESFTAERRGDTNFKGWRAEFLYAITDHLSVDTLFQTSSAIDPKIGGPHHYSQFKVETIYGF